MSLKIGIVGLPNVGKSTLFNALTRSHSAEAANYPFCTIEPNVGIVQVPDARLTKLAKIFNSTKIIPAIIEFVDIAGLVAGASRGEGLGNQFLANIRTVDAIVHVVRNFINSDIQHVSAEPDPANDIETIETELILADLNTVEKRLSNLKKSAKSGDKKLIQARDFVAEVLENLKQEKPAREIIVESHNQETFCELQLLTAKPEILAVNLAEKNLINFKENDFRAKTNLDNSTKIVPVSAQVESELIELSDIESQEFLADLGLKESSLNRLIRASYVALNLLTFFTAGPKEAHAWTVSVGATAPEAAGKIHTDFERNFIRAEVVATEKLIDAGSETETRASGDIRLEGKNYVVCDGDVCVFRTGG
jgi:ribosome-binding ATPase